MKTIILLSGLFILSSCAKRQYTCECTVAGGGSSDFVITDTQKNAIKKCQSYSTNSSGSAPTTCNVK